MQPGPDKCFLGCVFCHVQIATHTVDYVQHTLSMKADQLTECVPVAVLGSVNKFCFPGRKIYRQRETTLSGILVLSTLCT